MTWPFLWGQKADMILSDYGIVDPDGDTYQDS